MTKINEERMLAALFVNLGGKKRKTHDWIHIAKICKELVNYYGSTEILASKVGRTSNLIKMILRLLELPKEVQGLIKDGEIMFDIGQRIAGIKNPEDQKKVAKVVLGLKSEYARALIKYAETHPKSLDAYRKRIIKRTSIIKDKIEKINLMIIPLNEDVFKKLRNLSKRKRISPEKLAANMIKQIIDKDYT